MDTTKKDEDPKDAGGSTVQNHQLSSDIDPLSSEDISPYYLDSGGKLDSSKMV